LRSEIANRLAGEVLGRSLDELPPQARRVLELLDAWVTSSCREMSCERSDFRFTTRELRDALELGQTQAKIHLARLVDLEYLTLHRTAPGQPHVYELVYQGEGESGRAFLPGLLDPAELQYDGGHRSGLNAERSGVGRPLVGVRSGVGRTVKNVREPARENGSGRLTPDSSQFAYLEEAAESYVVAGRNGARS
jgi:hypothetical protein